MYPEQCFKCNRTYTPLSGASTAFCPSCVIALKTEAAEAEAHVKAVARGDIHVIPTSPDEKRQIRRAISDRMFSQPDCSYTPEKTVALRKMVRNKS